SRCYALSLHDALPISTRRRRVRRMIRSLSLSKGGGRSCRLAVLVADASARTTLSDRGTTSRAVPHGTAPLTAAMTGLPRSVLVRSEEHTSELQSRENL